MVWILNDLGLNHWNNDIFKLFATNCNSNTLQSLSFNQLEFFLNSVEARTQFNKFLCTFIFRKKTYDKGIRTFHDLFLQVYIKMCSCETII